MPLQRKRLQALTAHRPLKPVIGVNDRIPRFDAQGTAFAGTLQPMDSTADRQLYGEQAVRMKRLITTEGLFLEKGMGISVKGSDCRYRIVQPVTHWQGHSVAILEALD
ncbi:MAG: hypothetical protein J6K73_12315 [Clostridia bacterium]|nr:hypothetical protein [Clostridia bacterium]